MNHLGTKQRLCMASWILVAATLAWVNLFSFLALENAPMIGEPTTLRGLRAKMSLLENLTADRMRHLDDPGRLQRFFASYQPPKGSASTPGQSVGADHSAPGGIAATALPELAGVLQIIDRWGVPYYLAVLGGKVCAEKDEVRMFTVGPISAEGVVLQRSGQRWFLPSPRPYYNSDQGR